MNDLYVVYVFLRKELPFGCRDDCTCVRAYILVALFFKIAINSLTR